MPPRIAIQPSWRALTGTPHITAAPNTTSATARAVSTKAQTQKKSDFFKIAQARQRKAANLSRQQVLNAERKASLGDPVDSQSTPFIQEVQAIQAGSYAQPAGSSLNYYLKPDELNSALDFSRDLTEPIPNSDRDTTDPQLERETTELHHQAHQNAEEAIQRIVNLSNGNTKDRLRVNVQKCIDQFGRHFTDASLPPKPASVPHASAPGHLEKTPRVGPDTGSSEVQAAILTVKIINLSRHLQTANKDKHNKRNLQLLVHKRQKLLQYIRRKERGGPRWQNLMESLGLSDAAWKGEIAL